MYDIEGRTGNEAMLRWCHVLPMLRATFLLAARHVISGGATRLVSSHLISSVLTACSFTAPRYTHSVWARCLFLPLPTAKAVEVIRPLLHSTEPWVI